jgi:uracil-DNA glycosylase
MKIPELPPSWQAALSEEFSKPYFKDLAKFVDGERKANEVFPPEDEVFSALQLTPYDQVRVLLLGQDPYHDNNQAHGLCFSVKPGIKPPPSLVNMYKELESDLGLKAPKHGYLTAWAKQGMLMLNAVLTVRAHTPNSHKDKGWEQFTDAVIKKVNEKTDPVVFILWGGYAKKKAKLITGKHHVVIQGTHPSPLSANSGFFGSKPYSGINAALQSKGKPPIDWKLPADVSLPPSAGGERPVAPCGGDRAPGCPLRGG